MRLCVDIFFCYNCCWLTCNEQEHRDYDASRCHAFVCDISDERCQLPFPDSSLDVIICIFVLSAIHPDKYAVYISSVTSVCVFCNVSVLFNKLCVAYNDAFRQLLQEQRCSASSLFAFNDMSSLSDCSYAQFGFSFWRSLQARDNSIVNAALVSDLYFQSPLFKRWRRVFFLISLLCLFLFFHIVLFVSVHGLWVPRVDWTRVVYFCCFFRLFALSDLYLVFACLFSCTVFVFSYCMFIFLYCFVCISQVIGCEDRLQNDLYCVGWGVKLCSTSMGFEPASENK